MIVIAAVVGDWPDGSAQLQPGQHVLNGLPYAPIMRVSQGFGVRQPCCRASRAHYPVRGTSLPILVTGVLDVLVPIIEAVRHKCATCA
jgi:hypothetical protein